MSRFLRKAAVGLLAVGGVLGVAATPAAAADYPTDGFELLRFDPDGQGHGYTGGSITWYNRTANIQGTVVDTANNIGHVTAYFEAYAGSTKIESVTRTANTESDLGSPRDFNFTIGDTDLVGGIDRIKITLCRWDGASQDCAGSENYSKS